MRINVSLMVGIAALIAAFLLVVVAARTAHAATSNAPGAATAFGSGKR